MQFSLVIGSQRRKPATAWKEAARMVELEREHIRLEVDLLTCLGKIDRMQKKNDEMDAQRESRC